MPLASWESSRYLATLKKENSLDFQDSGLFKEWIIKQDIKCIHIKHLSRDLTEHSFVIFCHQKKIYKTSKGIM